MLITEFTTYDSVRMVLGLTERQLKDATLANEIYYSGLVAELRSVGASVLSTSDIIQDYENLVDDSGTIVPAATRFVTSFRTFAAHAVANQLLPALPEISPTFLSDSKASYRKNQNLSRIAEAFMRFRSLLQESYAAYLGVDAPESPRFNLMGVSSPTFDPVVG